MYVERLVETPKNQFLSIGPNHTQFLFCLTLDLPGQNLSKSGFFWNCILINNYMYLDRKSFHGFLLELHIVIKRNNISE